MTASLVCCALTNDEKSRPKHRKRPQGTRPPCLVRSSRLDRPATWKATREGKMTSSRPRLIRRETYTRAKTPIIVALAIIALVTIVGLIWFGWWDIAQNRRILASLPLPPGAERIEIDSHPVAWKDNFLAPPRSWSTAATFAIPGHSREYLLDFYVSRLSPEWDHCIRVFTPGVFFTRDNYTVSLSTEGASSPTRDGSFSIHISQDGGNLPCR